MATESQSNFVTRLLIYDFLIVLQYLISNKLFQLHRPSCRQIIYHIFALEPGLFFDTQNSFILNILGLSNFFENIFN